MTDLDEINQILAKSRELYDKGMTILNEGNLLLNDGIDKYPTNTALRLALAAHLSSSGNLTSAKEIYETVLQINPNDYFALTGLAVINFEQRGFSDAVELAKKSLSIKDTPEARILICRYHLTIGNMKEAKKILDIVLDKYPNDPSALLLKKGIEKMDKQSK